MKYYLYSTDALWNIEALQEEFDIPDFVTPYEIICNTISNRNVGRVYFNNVFDENTGDLCLMAVVGKDMDSPKFEYYRISRDKKGQTKWKLVLLGQGPIKPHVEQLVFSVDIGSDPMDEALKALRSEIDSLKLLYDNDGAESYLYSGSVSLLDSNSEDTKVILQYLIYDRPADDLYSDKRYISCSSKETVEVVSVYKVVKV